MTWDDLHTEEVLKDFKKRQPDAPTHIRTTRQGDKTTETPMTSNGNPTSSVASPSSGLQGQEVSAELAAAFLSWRPTVPSSWTTPPESKGAPSPSSPKSDKEFPLCRDIYIPQMLICSNNNLCNYAVHTPYSTPSTLVVEDTHSHTSANSFPCPTPKPITIAHSSTTNTVPIPILLHLASKHPLGSLYSDTGLLDPRSPLPIPHSTLPHQEAQEVQADTGGEETPRDPSPDEQADEWEDANQGVTWEDYGLSTVLKGFILNEGINYIPFNITLPGGATQPAKYIKVEWGEDPRVYRMIQGNPHQYVESFQATPYPSTRPFHTYTHSQLEFFKMHHILRPEVDNAIAGTYDQSITAEVDCYCYNKEGLKCDQREYDKLGDAIWKWQLTLAGCVHCLAGTRVLQRIEMVNRACLELLMQGYKSQHSHRS